MAGSASAVGFRAPVASNRPKLRSRGFGPGGRSQAIHLPAPASPSSQERSQAVLFAHGGLSRVQIAGGVAELAEKHRLPGKRCPQPVRIDQLELQLSRRAVAVGSG